MFEIPNSAGGIALSLNASPSLPDEYYQPSHRLIPITTTSSNTSVSSRGGRGGTTAATRGGQSGAQSQPPTQQHRSVKPLVRPALPARNGRNRGPEEGLDDSPPSYEPVLGETLERRRDRDNDRLKAQRATRQSLDDLDERMDMETLYQPDVAENYLRLGLKRLQCVPDKPNAGVRSSASGNTSIPATSTFSLRPRSEPRVIQPTSYSQTPSPSGPNQGSQHYCSTVARSATTSTGRVSMFGTRRTTKLHPENNKHPTDTSRTDEEG
ncbi:hypothetical protein V8F06_002816 [Rhypophila decipiens]